MLARKIDITIPLCIKDEMIELSQHIWQCFKILLIAGFV